MGTPIIFAHLFMMAMHVVDTVMTGQYGTNDLAGVSLALGVAGPTIVLVMAILGAVTPITAQLFGANRIAEIGPIGRQGLWLALVTGLVSFLMISFAEVAYRFVEADPEALAVTLGYLDAVRWGYIGQALYGVLRSLCEGMGRTKPAMVIAGSLLGVNALLNYALIFGKFGAPELGGVGSGIATAIVMWLHVVLMIGVMSRPFYRAAGIFQRGWRPDFATWWRFAKIGVPVGVTHFFEMGVYSLVTLLAASFGAVAVAGHTVAMNINGIAFMIPMSLGMAASIRVGHCVGADDYRGAEIVGQTALRTCLVYAAIAGIVLFLARGILVAAYIADPAVQEIAMTLMIFVAAYQFVDDTQATAIGVQRGYKDTRVPMAFALVGYWGVGLPVGCAFAYGWLGLPVLDIYGFWVGLTAGLAFVAVTVNVRRIRFGRDDVRVRAYALEGRAAA